jgi:electron transport complex protein RnfD
MNDNMIVSVSPHIRSNDSTTTIMRDVLIGLCPAVIVSVIFFGFRALLVEVFCAACCVFCEWLFEKGMKRPNTIGDLSAAVTGVILAMNLPVSIPLWQAAIGCVVAIIVVKQLFGGIGHNFANPALTARIVMFLAFSSSMATWTAPNFIDAVSSATPLEVLKTGSAEGLNLFHLALGAAGGSLGESSALALTLGGLYMMYRKVISWHIPLTYIGTVFILSLIKGGFTFAVAEILSGGLFLCAFFMASDYVTSPHTNKGRVIFALGCGLLTCLIRFYGSYPEGASFAVLLMNILTPYINRWGMTKPFGGVKA